MGISRESPRDIYQRAIMAGIQTKWVLPWCFLNSVTSLMGRFVCMYVLSTYLNKSLNQLFNSYSAMFIQKVASNPKYSLINPSNLSVSICFSYFECIFPNETGSG